jgi:haloalkane dehalogenase
MTTTPAWLDTAAYPFPPHSFATPEGNLHYVDTGQGSPVVMVHGTPTWSFEWRHLLCHLSDEYRCLALDHLGFGLSDHPEDASILRPEDHARRFADWVEHLGLQDITLVVHDLGGPIGLAYALEHPENVRAIVLINTIMWPLAGDKHFEGPAKLFSGALGRFLYEQMGFSAKVILPAAFGDKKKLTPAIHTQYLKPLATPRDRKGTYAFAKSLLGATDWLGSLWEKRERLAKIPALLVWGMKDPAFRPQELKRWRSALPSATFHPLEEVGHWPQEEASETLLMLLRDFLAGRR